MVIVRYGTAGNDTIDAFTKISTGEYFQPWQISGLGGDDFLRGGSKEDLIYGDGGNDTLDGEAGNDTLIGGDGNDKFDGDSGNDFLFGESGNDTMGGGPGNDFLFGGSGNDHLAGDYLSSTGNNTNDTLIGGDGNDRLDGRNGDDVLYGGADNDTLIGGLGNDTLSGNSGADKFQFNSASEGVDTITDFRWQENDEIYLSGSGFGGGLTNGFLQLDQFTLGSSASDSNDRVIYDSSNGDLFFDVDGSGSAAQVQIASLDSGLALIASDFVVF